MNERPDIEQIKARLAAPQARDDRQPISEKIAGITASVSPEEWERLPADLAQNLDHYLYGVKKSD